MPLDPHIQALLDKGTGVPATHTLPIDVARAQYESRIVLMAPAAKVASVREQTIDGPGGPLRIRTTRRAAMVHFRCSSFFTAAALCCAVSKRMGELEIKGFPIQTMI